MDALFIGQTYIDVTLVADAIPSGDEKAVARDHAVSFGGNAVTAAFACAKLGIQPDLLTSLARIGWGACSPTWRRAMASSSIRAR